MADIFLSYAREDARVARRVADLLEAHGWTVWWDRKITAGAEWRNMIEGALREMRCMVVLWSKHSVQSEWVTEEAEEARTAKKLVPVMIEPTIPPLGFRRLHAVDLSEWVRNPDVTMGIAPLVRDLAALLGPPPRARLGEETVMRVLRGGPAAVTGSPTAVTSSPASTLAADAPVAPPAPQTRPDPATTTTRAPTGRQGILERVPMPAFIAIVALIFVIALMLAIKLLRNSFTAAPLPQTSAPAIANPPAARTELPVTANPAPVKVEPAAAKAEPPPLKVELPPAANPVAKTQPQRQYAPTAERPVMKTERPKLETWVVGRDPPPAQPATSPPAREWKRGGKSPVSARCSELLQRAAIDPAFSEQDKTELIKECKT